MREINNPDNPVVLFIPEAGIYPFLRGLALLGDVVAKKGGRVLVTRDTGQMLRSPMMTMRRTPANVSEKDKAKINKASDKMLKSALQKYRFSTIELSEMLDVEAQQEIDALNNVPYKNLENISFRGFPVGKIAQYDFILETKFPYSQKLSEEHKALYLAYIKNTALAIALTDNICQKYKPSLIMTFNEYAQCQGVRFSAQSNNVARMALTYAVHLNTDCSRFPIWESTYEHWRYNHCQKWKTAMNTPIDARSVNGCWKDVVFRLYSSGSHIFSSQKISDPALIFEKLKLDSNKKTIVVYTSSQDERKSVETAMKIWKEGPDIVDAFPNQIEWLKILRDYAANRNDIQIIVRIHPREGKRQYGFDSQHLTELKATFTQNTGNFIIVWPDDAMSSYDLMELADICLVSWSLMGQEAVRLGIPVLSCTGNMFYPDDDFIQVATTPTEYKEKFDSMIDMRYTWRHLVKAIRFYHWRIFIPSLDLGETVPVDVMDDTLWPEAPSSKIKVINDILSSKQDVIKYNIDRWQSHLPKDATALESEAIRRGIRYFLDKIFYPPTTYSKKMVLLFRVYRKSRKILLHLFGKKTSNLNSTEYYFSDYDLKFATNTSNLEDLCEETRRNKKLRILVEDGLGAILVNKGKTVRRMSPLIVRLAKLHDSSLK